MLKIRQPGLFRYPFRASSVWCLSLQRVKKFNLGPKLIVRHLHQRKHPVRVASVKTKQVNDVYQHFKRVRQLVDDLNIRLTR